MSRFIGKFSAERLAFFSEPAPATLSGARSLTVFATGYISNLHWLRQEAHARGVPPARDTAQWLAGAFLWWGPNLSRYILGQFAAAIVDHTHHAVTLLQDSFGICPLFYAVQGPSLCFASQLIDLVTLVRPGALDMAYFADTLAKALPSTAHTPYQGLQRLQYGACLRWQRGTLQRICPWSPADVPPTVLAPEAEYEEALRTTLHTAIDQVIPRRDTVWCELSGGLDSTSVLAVALGLGHHVEPVTFVNHAGDDEGDTAIAQQVVAALHLPWHTLDASSTRPFASVPGDFRAEPGTETHCDRQARYQELLCAHGVHVVLTGVGGDVTFGSPDCQPYHLADPLYRGQLVLLWRVLQDWARRDPRQRSLLFWLTQYAVRTAFLHLVRHTASRPGVARRLPSWLSRPFVRAYRLRARYRTQHTPRHPEPGRHALWEEVYLQAASLSVGALRYPATEFRHPLLDRRLVELMLSIPFAQRQQADHDRYLQRRALRTVLPPVVLQRRNKGSGQQSFDAGLRTSAAWLHLLGDTPRLVTCGFVDCTRWHAELQRVQFGLYESLPHFAMAACIECWLRRYEAGLPAPDFHLTELSV
jgi:asparagine synthase (glutamine-hydrolysing)